LDEVGVRDGALNCAWFVASNVSNRSCTFTFSVASAAIVYTAGGSKGRLYCPEGPETALNLALVYGAAQSCAELLRPDLHAQTGKKRENDE